MILSCLFNCCINLTDIETPNITVGTGLVVSPSGPVIIGQSTCIDTSSGSTHSVQISCQLENEMAARRYTISWSRNGHDLSFSGNIYTTTQVGTYMCKAKNDCGSDTATTTVTSKFSSITLLHIIH